MLPFPVLFFLTTKEKEKGRKRREGEGEREGRRGREKAEGRKKGEGRREKGKELFLKPFLKNIAVILGFDKELQ